MNGWTSAVLLLAGWSLVTWAVAELAEARWPWLLGAGVALLIAGAVLFLSLVSEARNNPEGRRHG